MTLLKKAKSLRSSQTESENKLWYHLRAHRFMGFKFKRQKPIGSYIVDFVCWEQKLVIELDGGQHAEQIEYDSRRTKYLENEGYKVLRFWNNQVMSELESVLEAISIEIALSPTSHKWARGFSV
jgi:very-short-patch-repair endonuclease